MRFGHLPADLNSGTVSVDIPVYDYVDKDFRIPITLHYSSSGFQPYFQTGEAGLHWTLVAGGAITREIVGKDDFKQGGIFGNRPGLDEADLYGMMLTVGWNSGYEPWSNGQTYVETTSDIYRFSFMGHSGSFIFLHDGKTIKVFGTQNGKGTYSVEYEGGNESSFTITTGDGYRYRFGHSPEYSSNAAKEQMWQQAAKYQGDTGYDHTAESLTTVTWLLDRITTPNGRTVHFQYVTRRRNHSLPLDDEDVVTSFRKKLPGPGKLPNGQTDTYYKAASMTYTSYLRRIVVDSLSLTGCKRMVVDFGWEKQSSREVAQTRPSCYRDLVVPLRKLKTVKVYLGEVLSRDVSLSYAMSGLRPLLKSVSISGMGTYQMDYINESTPLPDMLTNGVDFWGYYNGRDDLGDQYVSALSPDASSSVPDEYVASDFQNPSSVFSVLGNLMTVKYPTGGQTDFTYEANRARQILLRRKQPYQGGSQPIEQGDSLQGGADSVLYLSSLFPVLSMLQSDECGGVRIASLTDRDGLGHTSERTFSYCDSLGRSSGIVQQFPRFSDGSIYGFLSYNPFVTYPGSSFDQLHVAYSRVTETFSDGSSITTDYTDWESDPDTFSQSKQLTQNALPDPPPSFPLSEWQVFMDNILREADSRSYRRGHPCEVVMKDAMNQIVCRESIAYLDYPQTEYTAYVVGSGRYWWSARRFLCDYLPVTRDVVKYADNGSPREEHRRYQYGSMNQLFRDSYRVNGDSVVTVTVCSGDSLLQGSVFAGMRADGLRTCPVESMDIRNGKVIRAHLIEYGQFGELYLPSAEYEASLDMGIPEAAFLSYSGQAKDPHYGATPEIAYLEHDEKGNVTLSKDRSGLATSYVWTDDKYHPAAIFTGAKNGTRTQIVSENIEGAVWADLNGLSSYGAIDIPFICSRAGEVAVSLDFVKEYGRDIWWRMDNGTEYKWEMPDLGPDEELELEMLFTGNLSAGAHLFQVTTVQGVYLSEEEEGEEEEEGQGPCAAIGYRFGMKNPILDPPSWGIVTVSYPSTRDREIEVRADDCLFEDFEDNASSSHEGFHGGKSHSGIKTLDFVPHPDKTYVMDWQECQTDGTWQYRSSTVNGQGTFTVGGAGKIIDHVRVFPLGATVESYTWDAAGNLTSKTDSRGVTESYGYDGLGRLTGVFDNQGNKTEGYQYHFKIQ